MTGVTGTQVLPAPFWMKIIKHDDTLDAKIRRKDRNAIHEYMIQKDYEIWDK